MRKLARYLSSYKKQVIIGPIFKLIEAVFELIIPMVTAQVIDHGVKTGDVAYVWQMGGIMLLLGVVGLGCALVCQKMASIASQGFGTVVRNDLYHHINSLSHREIDHFGTPSLITRITNDVNQLQYAVAMLIRLVIRAPFLAIGAIVMAMMIDLPLSLVFIIATPLIALVLYFIMSRSVPYFRTMQKKLDRISLVAREGLSGVRVVRAFSKQEYEEERFEKAAQEQTSTAVQVGKLSALLNPLTYTIVNFAVIAIVWFGGYRVEEGGMTQGEVIAFVNYMSQTLLALIVVANLVVTFTKASAAAGRVNEVLDTVTSVPEAQEPVVIFPAQAPKVQFEDVCLAYGGSQKYALDHFSLTVQPGEIVGIIGGTGSGKSTVVNLIPRFYDATKGCVKVDGVDVREYPFEQLRSKIGVVPQEALLFSGTIRDNMRWGKPAATEKEIEQALDIAQAKEVVDRLPTGLDSTVSRGGRNFSGGQRQRLTIARALVSKPEILILDDSASALDFATDAALRRALRHNTKGMTIFMVSQRASTIRNADQIVVMDEGKAVGIGTHEQLMEDCDVYREICLSQMSREEVER